MCYNLIAAVLECYNVTIHTTQCSCLCCQLNYPGTACIKHTVNPAINLKTTQHCHSPPTRSTLPCLQTAWQHQTRVTHTSFLTSCHSQLPLHPSFGSQLLLREGSLIAVYQIVHHLVCRTLSGVWLISACFRGGRVGEGSGGGATVGARRLLWVVQEEGRLTN